MSRLVLALVTASVALLAVTGIASAKNTERLVVRGQDTVVDAPCSPAGCEMQIADGTFRGTTGSGSYAGSLKLDFANVYPNGEGGLCAPVLAAAPDVTSYTTDLSGGNVTYTAPKATDDLDPNPIDARGRWRSAVLFLQRRVIRLGVLEAAAGG